MTNPVASSGLLHYVQPCYCARVFLRKTYHIRAGGKVAHSATNREMTMEIYSLASKFPRVQLINDQSGSEFGLPLFEEHPRVRNIKSDQMSTLLQQERSRWFV